MPSEEWKLKTFHEKWYAGEVISVGIGQGAVAISPVQLVRAIAGIASGGVLKRPHVVEPDQLPADYRHAIYDSYPGSGNATIPMSPAVWETITDGMALTTNSGTAAASHLANIDFAASRHSAGGEPQRRHEESRHRGSAPTPRLWASLRAAIRISPWWSWWNMVAGEQRRPHLWLRGLSKPLWISSAGWITTFRKPPRPQTRSR